MCCGGDVCNTVGAARGIEGVASDDGQSAGDVDRGAELRNDDRLEWSVVPFARWI